MDLLAKSQTFQDLKSVLTLNVFWNEVFLLPEITSIISELDVNWNVSMELPSDFLFILL